MKVLGLLVGAALMWYPLIAMAQNPLDEVAPPQPQPQPALPGFLKPGARLTFHGGDSTIAGKRWVMDNERGYVKFADGNWYRPEQRHGGGGVGYVQLNILISNPQCIAADIQHYLNIDAQQDLYTQSSVSSVSGDQNELGDFWINPQRLAAMANQEIAHTKVHRLNYQLGERTYNAISIRYTGPGRYSSKYYDLDSGILLFMGASDVDPSVNVTDPNGNVQQTVRGNATFSHLAFVNVRDTTIPWANEAPPAWVRQGGMLQYQGVNRLVVPGTENLGQLPGQAVAVGVQFTRVGDGVAAARVTQQSDLGRGLPPDQTSVDRLFGSAMFNGVWIPPAALGTLRANQVLDQDPHTRFQWIVAGAGMEGTAVIIERGPTETFERSYNMQSGVLSAFRITRTMVNRSQSVAEYRLAGQQ